MHEFARRSLFISCFVLFVLSGAAAVFAASGEEIWHDYLAGGNPEEMHKQFEEALKENPDDAYAAAGLGFIEDSRCRPERAIDHWIQATEAFVDDPVAELFLHCCIHIL